MSIYFTSDTHWGHCNIIKYCNRPFKDGDHQNEEMIKRFNEVLRPGDTLYHLGDVCHSATPVGPILDRLKVGQIHLIYGNHDKPRLLQHPKIVWTGLYKSIQADNRHIFLCHYALRNWQGRGNGAYHLYGHSHGRLPGDGRSMDVGVDTNNFYPYSISDIKSLLEPIEYKQEDE